MSQTELPSRGGLGQRAASGLFWVTGMGVSGQVVVLLTQLLLGIILAQSDFGIYALATGATGMVMVLRGGGVQRLLVQAPKLFARRLSSALFLAGGFNVTAAIILCILSLVLDDFYNTPQLTVMLLLVASELLISTPTIVFKARLLTQHRFREVSIVDSGSVILRNALILSCALYGLGPISFVLPAPFVVLIEVLVYARLAKLSFRESKLSLTIIREIFRSSLWIIVATLAIALIVNGTYMVVGAIETKEFVGIFFFGFTMVSTSTRLVARNFNVVLLPILSSIGDDPERHRKAFLRFTKVMFSLMTFFSFGVASASPALIHLLWGGKWDASIPVVVMMSLAQPLLIYSSINTVFLESKGHWRFAALVMLGQGVSVCVAAGIGLWLGGMLTMLASILTAHFIFIAIKLHRICGLQGIPATRVWLTLGGAGLPIGACSGLSALIYLVPTMPVWLRLILVASCYAALAGGVIMIFQRSIVTEFLSLIRAKRSRAARPPAQ